MCSILMTEEYEPHYRLKCNLNISNNVRQQIWNKYFSDSITGHCYNCVNESFGKRGFSVYNIKENDDNSIENLRPFCMHCAGSNMRYEVKELMNRNL